MSRDYKYCPQCATAFEIRIISELERLACPGCKFIFWQNPVVGVAVIALEESRILLGRRSRGEYTGQWCIPCGYVEYHEDVREAARREFLEETGLIVNIQSVYTVQSNFHNPAMHTVGIWFMSEVSGGTLQPADDIDKVEWFELGNIPQEMAFPTDKQVLDSLLAEQ
ncbi:MAG: NUDIX hydrolase [Pseudomonadales bacterium]|nr:NUDIX hydrolase [Pseudomonadales bacterium]